MKDDLLPKESEDYVNYPRLWNFVKGQFQCGLSSIHGPDHWHRVEENGLYLAKETDANSTIVRLFAIFHDSRRENDYDDPQHGLRGAELAYKCRGDLFDVRDADFEKLYFACEHHTHERFNEDPTIGTCWDADRLDLPRVGISPREEYMSTEFGKEIARSGGFS